MSLVLAFFLLLLAFLLGTVSVWGLERMTEKGWRPGFWYEGLEALELPLVIVWLLLINSLAVFKAVVGFTGNGPEYLGVIGWTIAGGGIVLLVLAEFFIGIRLDKKPSLHESQEDHGES